MKDPMLELESVTKRFPGAVVPAVRELTLSVPEGTVTALVGPSGSGKTTALKTINRLVEPTSGRVRIDGIDHRSLAPAGLRRRIGYVFQGVGLFSRMTVAENVAEPLRLNGVPRREHRRRVDELLALVSLSPGEMRERFPEALSGGERQRVGVARALAASPRLVLMDEPFAALDAITRDGLQRAYGELARRLGVTTVLVTHDMSEALLMADRLAVLAEGTLRQLDTPANVVRAPADETVRGLIETPKRQSERIHALLGGDPPA